MKKSQWLIINSQWFFPKSLRYIFLFITSLLAIHAHAQSVSAVLDRDKILLGEQVTLQLSVSNIDETNFFVNTWPQVNDTINHAEIIKRTNIDTINVNAITAYQQSFIITSFDSGRWQLGPFDFVIQEKSTGKKLKLETTPVYLTVLPVNVSSLKDYHPIKDIIDVESSFNWLPVIIGAIVILLAIIIFIFIKKRKKKPVQPAKAVLKGTPLERALEKLNALQNESLSSMAIIKKFHSETDIVTREYLEEVTHIKALHLTTAELLPRLKIYMQDADFRNMFTALFDLNAAVKFAKYMPAEEESRSTLKDAIKLLKQIDETINKARTDADRLVPKY